MTLSDERERNGKYKLQPIATAPALYSTVYALITTIEIYMGMAVSEFEK